MKRCCDLFVSSVGVMAFAGAAIAAQTVELRDWEFRREGDAWARVRVPHDWAIAGPFDKEIDKQVVAIVENGEKVAKEKTGRTGSLPWLGKGEYRTTANIPEDRYRLWWNEVRYEPGELKVVAYGKDGKPALTETVRTAGKPARVELAKRRFGELLFVAATIVDEKGVPVPDADDELFFTCGKGLEFVAICNGDATSTESFVVPHMKAFHGQLVAIFRGAGDEVSCERR